MREIKSKAPTPSVDVVASGSSSVRSWRACAMHLQPAFVVMAHWHGLVASQSNQIHDAVRDLSEQAARPPRKKNAMIWRRPKRAQCSMVTGTLS